MGWGIDFKADIFLNKVYVNSKYDLECQIEDCKEELKIIKTKLYMFSSSSPKQIVSKEWKDDVLGYIQIELNNLFEEYDITIEKLINLKYLLKNYDEYEKNKISNFVDDINN